MKVSDPAPVFVMLTLAGARLEVPICPARLEVEGFTVSTKVPSGPGVVAPLGSPVS